MVWCWQAISHYPSQCLPISVSLCDVTRPQSVNIWNATRLREILEAIFNDVAQRTDGCVDPLKVRETWTNIYVYVWIVVITVPADGLALLGARTYAGTVMTKLDSHINTREALRGWVLYANERTVPLGYTVVILSVLFYSFIDMELLVVTTFINDFGKYHDWNTFAHFHTYLCTVVKMCTNCFLTGGLMESKHNLFTSVNFSLFCFWS